MTSPGKTFPVGKVVGLRGLRGQLKVRPQTNNPELLLDIRNVEIKDRDGLSYQSDIKSIEIVKGLVLIKLHGFEDRTACEKLLDAEIFVDISQLSSLTAETWWVSDLIGLDVYTTTGTHLGIVCSIIDTSGQLLEVQPPQTNKTILIPFVKALVPSVDLKERRIEIDEIPGLLEPQ